MELRELQRLAVPRNLKPPNFGDIVCTQLHYFADASEQGYGIIGLLDRERVAPLKKDYYPQIGPHSYCHRCEMHHKLIRELSHNTDMIFVWIDSMAVLKYTTNGEKTTCWPLR